MFWRALIPSCFLEPVWQATREFSLLELLKGHLPFLSFSLVRYSVIDRAQKTTVRKLGVAINESL